MIDKPRVRFAPSPTGELHVGNARTALFNWLFARHFGGSFILRIEDTDESRSALSYQLNLLEDLQWLGLDWDEGPQKNGAYGPYQQSQRLAIYTEHLNKLKDADLVYPCYCTAEELEEERQTLILSKRMPRYMGKCRQLTLSERNALESQGRIPAWRFKVPPTASEFHDLIRGPMKFAGDAIGDFIIIRSNGMPAYNFAVVIDDHLMNITHIIRGEDHLSNTALQLMLYRAFGYHPPVFAHHCLILGKDHAKLSKRHGSVSVGEFRKRGFLPAALVNYLGLLGSSFTGGREVIEPLEMIEAFSLERASKSGAVFDEDKLSWLNAIYIRNLSADTLMEKIAPFLLANGYQTENLDSLWLKKAIAAVQDELTTLGEIDKHLGLFFDERWAMTKEALKWLDSEKSQKVILSFAEFLAEAAGSPQNIYVAAIQRAKEQSGARGRDLFMPIRAALTGKLQGPELDKIFDILGKEVAEKRLQNALKQKSRE